MTKATKNICISEKKKQGIITCNIAATESDMYQQNLEAVLQDGCVLENIEKQTQRFVK